MKVKLLKKVHRRFSIVHHPQGLVIDGEIFAHNLYAMYDNTNGYRTEYAQLGKTAPRPDGKSSQWCSEEKIFGTTGECLAYLKSQIIVELIRDGHRNRKMRQVMNAQTKVWYK